MRRRTVPAARIGIALVALGILSAAPADRTDFDAGRLRTGSFVYRIVERGQEVAKLTCTIRKRPDGNYDFTGEATGAFGQRWESTATPSLEPISATLRSEQGERLSSFRLRYDRAHVTGHAKKAEEKSIDERLPAGTVDQRIDWAAVLSSPLETGQQFDFPVYDPWSGVSHVVGRVGKVESIRVPAGTFEVYRITYRIESPKGAEPYQMLATKDAPHVAVREDFPGVMRSELVEIRDAP
jgi:uncharacterized protein DUF3108